MVDAPGTETLALYAVVLAAIALGFVFGVGVTGRLAFASLGPVMDTPQWVTTAKRLRLAAAVAVGVFAVAGTALWELSEE